MNEARIISEIALMQTCLLAMFKEVSRRNGGAEFELMLDGDEVANMAIEIINRWQVGEGTLPLNVVETDDGQITIKRNPEW